MVGWPGVRRTGEGRNLPLQGRADLKFLFMGCAKFRPLAGFLSWSDLPHVGGKRVFANGTGRKSFEPLASPISDFRPSTVGPGFARQPFSERRHRKWSPR